MSTPYDIDPQDPDPPSSRTSQGRTLPQNAPAQPARPQEGQAAGRASDILREHATHQQPSRLSTINGGERGATRFDDAAILIFRIALIVVLLSLGYLCYGLWGGILSDPHFDAMGKADHLRIMGIIDVVSTAMRFSVIVALIALLFLYYDQETSGYVLLGVALIFALLMPFATGKILDLTSAQPSMMTDTVLKSLKQMAWLPGVPSVLLILFDIYRRIAGGLEQAQIKRATLRYGQGISKQTKHRNIFMGYCWNMPYCRDAIRAKCPIFVQHRGPCWRHKRGCMCEESIILQAQSGDWKQRVAGAVGQMEQQKDLNGRILGSTTGPVLNAEQKKERCRQCVIYNKHQEQKYKLLVTVTFAVVFGVVALLSQNLVSVSAAVYATANSVMNRLSYNAASSGQPIADTSAAHLSTPVSWVILGVITIIVLSKLLQLVEYCCFKLKV